MNQPRDLAPLIGRMVVNGETLEGEKLADYLQQMPYDDFVSLMEDISLVEIDTLNESKTNQELRCVTCDFPLSDIFNHWVTKEKTGWCRACRMRVRGRMRPLPYPPNEKAETSATCDVQQPKTL